MPDIAELEIKVDSTDTVSAKGALDGFTAAADDAQKATDKLAASTGKARDENGRFIKGATGAAKATGAAGKAANKSGKDFDTLGKSMDFAKKQALALAGAFTFINIIRDATQVVGGFEQATATLGGVMRKTADEMRLLTEQAKLMGATTRFSATQAAEAQLALARAGQNQQQVLASLPSVLALASGAQLQLGESAGFVSQALAQFSLDAMEAGRVADVFVGVSNRANTDVRQLAEGMKVVGPVASKLGNDLEGTAAALGVLANAGLQGSVGATALRSALSRLAAPSKEAEGIIAKLAKTSGQSRDAFDSSKRTILELFKAFNKAGAETSDLVKVFGQEGLAGALTLIAESDGLATLGEQARNVTGEAQDLADAMNNTLQGAMANLRSAVESLYIAFGESGLAGGLRIVVDALTITVRSMAGVESKTGEFSKSAEVLAVGLKALVFGLKVAAVAFTAIAVEAAAARIATVGLTVSIQGLKRAIASTGIGLLVVGIGELGAAMLDGNDAITDMVDDMKELDAATRKTRKSTDELTEAQKRQEQQTLKNATPFEILKARYLELSQENERLFKSIRDTLNEQNKVKKVTDEMAQAYALAVKEGTAMGLSMEDARKRAQLVSQAFGALVQVQQNLTNRLDEVKNASDRATKDMKEDVSELAKAWQQLLARVADSSFIDPATRDLDRLLSKFRQLALAEGFDDQGVEDFLKGIAAQFSIIEKNNGLSKAITQGRNAFKQLADEARKLEQDNTLLSLSGGSTRSQVMAQYAETIRSVQREVAILLTSEKISTQEALARVEALDALIDRITQGRDRQKELTAQMEAATAASERLRSAQQGLVDLISSINSSSLEQFPRSLAEGFRLIGDLEAQAREAGTSLEQLGLTVSRVWGQTVLGVVNGVFDSILDRAADLSIQLIFDAEHAEDVKEAVNAFMQDIQKLLVREIIIQPVIDSIKQGIGSVLGGVQDQGSDAIMLQAGTALGQAAIQLQGAAGALQGSALRQTSTAVAQQTAAAQSSVSAVQGSLAAGQSVAAAGQHSAAAGQLSAAAGQLSASGGGGGGGGGSTIGAIAGLVGGAVLVGSLIKSIADAKANPRPEEDIKNRRSATDSVAATSSAANEVFRFARGGVLRGPVAFPMRRGTGIAGEAGPEAILPARRSGGGFAVEADVAGRNMLANVSRMNSGKMGVRMFARGGVVGAGTPHMSLAQPSQGERRFPTAEQPSAVQRGTVVNMTVNARDAGSFKRSQKQIRKGIRRL